MRRDLGPGDLGDLLQQPHLAVLATRLRDGATALSPVWHEWADGEFVNCIPDGDPKLAQIRREPAVSVLVAEQVLPYRGIEVRGVASVTRQPYGVTMRRLALRYFGAGADDLYPDTAAGVVIRVRPGHTRCWDFADDMAALDGGASRPQDTVREEDDR